MKRKKLAKVSKTKENDTKLQNRKDSHGDKLCSVAISLFEFMLIEIVLIITTMRANTVRDELILAGKALFKVTLE